MALVIYGATGFTGGLIVEEAHRRGLRPILAGRRREALEILARKWRPALEIRVAQPDDRASLDAMLQDAKTLITTVGPFTDFGLKVAAAAVDHGVHYLDTTGEQTFMADCRAMFHERMQIQNRVMINAAAFEYTPGILAAARLLRDHPNATTIDIIYDMGMGSGSSSASRGTLKSMLRLAGAEGIGYEGGSFIPMRTLDSTKTITMEDQHEQIVAQFPAGEILAVPRFSKIQNICTWIVLPTLVSKMRPLSQAMLKGAQDGIVYSALSAIINRLPSGPTDSMRAASDGQIILQAEDERISVICPDPYGLTAHIAINFAMRLQQNDYHQNGVISAAEAFDLDDQWTMLEQQGVSYNSNLIHL